METSGLTDKNMANKRFLKTEQAIFIAYYKFRDCPTAKRIAKYANISRTTLYRHHKKVQKIPYDYEDFLVKAYTKATKKFLKKDDICLKLLFLRILVFIKSNSKVVSTLFDDGHKEIIKKMLNVLKPAIISRWGITKNKDKIYTIYENEVLGVIENWYHHGFDKNHLNATLEDILYLTSNACRRLSRLN